MKHAFNNYFDKYLRAYRPEWRFCKFLELVVILETRRVFTFQCKFYMKGTREKCIYNENEQKFFMTRTSQGFWFQQIKGYQRCSRDFKGVGGRGFTENLRYMGSNWCTQSISIFTKDPNVDI